MKARMRWRRSSVEVKLPRLMTRRARIPNHRSIWLSQEVWFGVSRNWRRWAGSLRKAARGDQPNQRLGLVGVEVVGEAAPGRVRVGVDDPRDVRGEVGLGPGRPQRG